MKTPSRQSMSRSFSSSSSSPPAAIKQGRSFPRQRPLLGIDIESPISPLSRPRKHRKLSHHVPKKLLFEGRLIKENNLSLEPYEVCEIHDCCEHVGLEEFSELLRQVQDLAGEVVPVLDDESFIQWVYSEDEIEKVLEAGPLNWTENCRYCWLANFLRGHASHVWLVCLKLLGKVREFKRSIGSMKADGDETSLYEKWIDDVCEAFNRNLEQ